MKVFVEEQRFKKWILVSVMTMPIVGGVLPLILAENEIPTFNSPGFWGITVTTIAIILVFLLMLSVKLQTKINEQGIYYQFFPNQCRERHIPWVNISECYVTKYNSLRKFGGYGYRRCYFGKKGLVMNIGGKYGIQLVLKNGKKIMIGTQNKIDAERVLTTYATKINIK